MTFRWEGGRFTGAGCCFVREDIILPDLRVISFGLGTILQGMTVIPMGLDVTSLGAWACVYYEGGAVVAGPSGTFLCAVAMSLVYTTHLAK